MKFILRRTWAQLTLAFVIVASVAIVANVVATSATGNGTSAGKDLNELRPMPQGHGVGVQNKAKPADASSLAGGTGPAHGIVNNSQAPFPAGQYVITNQWQDLIGGRWIQVYAGSLYGDPSQGVVIVRVSAEDWSTSQVASVAKVPGGQLRIVSASGPRLVLQNSAGSHLIFDAIKQQFV